MDAELLETSVTRLHIGNAAEQDDEAMRKDQVDTALVNKSDIGHTHSQLHAPATVAVGDGVVALVINGQELSGSLTLASGSGLEKASGLKVKFGNGSTDVSPGDHVHEDDHAAATMTPTDTMNWTGSVGQAFVGNVNVVINGGLMVVAGLGGGLAVDFGTGSNQVPRGNHTHPVVTSLANGLMTPAMLTTLNVLSADDAPSFSNTQTMNIRKFMGVISGNVNYGVGLTIDPILGLVVDFNYVAQKEHAHAVTGGINSYAVTNPGAYTSPPAVTVTGDGTDATAIATLKATAKAIVNAGTGYPQLGVLTAGGGTSTNPLVLQITSVDGSGAILGVNIISAGNYSSVPANPVAFTGGGGASATFNITWGVGLVTPTNTGHGYTVAAVSFDTGAAAATPNVWLDPGFISLGDSAKIIAHDAAITAQNSNIAAASKAATGDLVPYAAQYDGSGAYILALTTGRGYRWTKAGSDTNCVNGDQTLTDTGGFISEGNSVTLHGTPNAAITAQVRDETAEQIGREALLGITNQTALDPNGGLNRGGSGIKIATPVEQVVALTANNTAITPTGHYLKLTSDDATPANRVFTLAAPAAYGWELEVYFSGSNSAKLVKDSNASTCYARLDADWVPISNASISLFWNGTDWIEKARKGTPTSVLASIASNGIVVRTAADTYTTRQIVSSDGSLAITNPTGAAGDFDIKLAPAGMQTVAYAPAVVVDFDGEPIQTINLTGNIALSTQNWGGGKSVQVRLVADGNERGVTLTPAIRTYGDLVTSVLANKELLVSFTSFGASEADTRAAFGVEP